MLIRHREAEPTVDASAFVAPTAVLVGRVSVGPRARVMYGAGWTRKPPRSRSASAP